MAIIQSMIAAQLGVSQMTVSRALRGEKGISEETRSKILEAARRAGLPLPPSRRRAADPDRLHVICTIAAEPSGERRDSPFHGRLLDGLRRGARECASEVINCPEIGEFWPVVVARGQVDGVALVWGDEHTPLPAAPCPVPRAFLFHGPPRADVVTVDNFDGGMQLGRYLGARGHRRVAFIGPETRMARERLAGLRMGLELTGGECPVGLAKLKPGGGGRNPELVDDLLAGETRASHLRRRFTAIAHYNDFFAVNTIARLRERGLKVPKDLSVVGFDGACPAWYEGPELTTCAIPLEELGAEAARFVYWRLEHPNALRRKLVLETELVAGATVAKADTGNGMR